MKKGIVIALCLVLGVFTLIYPAFSAALTNIQIFQQSYSQTIQFKDLNNKHWAYSAIRDMVRYDVIKGYSDQTFKPENPVSRQEFSTMLMKAMDKTVNEIENSSYVDVKPTDWALTFIEAAKPYFPGKQQNGKQYFYGDLNANREDVAAAIVKAKGYDKMSPPNLTLLNKFSDQELISPDLKTYIAIAVDKGLISGFPDGTFGPTKPLTRSQVASMLYRAKLNLFGKPVELKWKTKIGKTTYRSTIQAVNSNVIVNSNGSSYGPGGDKEDGVYIIDSKTGNLIRQIIPPDAGENDVNGVAIDPENNIYFGTDNNRLYKTSLDGKTAWTFQTKGHVESAPSIADLNSDGTLELVVGDEQGYIYALKTTDGTLIWQFDANLYQNENDIYNYLTKAFNGSPALTHLDNDSNIDVLIGCRDGILYAIEGKTGKILWGIPHDSAINSSPLVVGKDFYYAETYSMFYKYSIKDGQGSYWNFEGPDYAFRGFFSSPAYLPNINKYAIGSDWFDDKEALYVFDQSEVIGLESEQKFSATNLVTDLNNDNYPELWAAAEGEGTLGDKDKAKGKLYLVDTAKLAGKYGAYEQLNTININDAADSTFLFDGAIEATPTISDIDNDGNLELLVASLDGYLYCYSLNQTGRVYWGQFRGNNQNTGAMKL